MGTFKGLQILLAINQQTKTSYLPARVRAFGLPLDDFLTGFPLDFALVLDAGLAIALPPVLSTGFPARDGFAFALPLLRFS